jgi:thiol-disulfide isomerase/thioredoxin
VLARGVRFVKAGPENDVARLVRTEREKAAADGRDLVVYVGAKWCEPCKHFHEACLRGDLDGEFPQLTILEFDLDEDRDRITVAGYMSKLIPLFVMPGEDGRATARRFEGGVKGDGAVEHITPRLRKLLEK